MSKPAVLAIALLSLLISSGSYADGAAASPAPASDTTTTAPTTPAPTTTAPTTTAPTTTAPTTTAPTTTAPTTTTTAETTADPQARIEELSAQIAELTKKLDAAELVLATAERDLASERDARARDSEAAKQLQSDLFNSVDTANAEVDDLKSKLEARDSMADDLSLLEGERDSLASSLAAEKGGRFNLEEWPNVLVTGFDEATPRIGKWTLTTTKATQTNPREFFSRLDFPLEQAGQPFLYRFTAKAGGDGWVGLGIHFFASGVKSKKGYGEGRSLLVWLTRDPAVRKTDATWLQLYRSDTDVIMERVLDSKLEEAIGDSLGIEVAYDPGSGYVTVAVDGRLAVKYRAWFGIEEGVGVSLRTLGAGGSFSDFEVRTAAGD